MNTVGLYLHIPFCKSKCRYCDFCSFPHPKAEAVERYVDSLSSEIEAGKNILASHFHTGTPLVDTIFFGGGTPTLLSACQFDHIFSALGRHYSISRDAEITVECNPATATRDYLRALRSLGINRLSLGVQSMNDDELKLLGRLHKAEDVLRTIWDAREAGFDNISVDIMFGIPAQTRESLANTLDKIASLEPNHVSVYGLQIEDGTYFARHRDTLPFPDEDTEGQMYMDTVERLAECGIFQYEISNFSHPGYESRHNLKYWRRQDYLGLGLAAHSCLGARRFFNTEDMDDYLAGHMLEGSQTISDHDILAEKIMLGLRLCEGVDLDVLCAEHGDRALAYGDAFAPYVSQGLMCKIGSRLAFTAEGLYVSNAILSEVLEFEELD